MAIDFAQIKDLRDRTGVSISACKKALEEADGDAEKAVELLRKKGAAKAADRAERGTSFAVVRAKKDGDKIAMIELKCETDFVARDDSFISLAESLVDKALSGEITSSEDEVEEVKEAVLRLGENIQLGGVAVLEGGVTGSYVHSNNLIGVIVKLEGGNEDLARDIAMHAAATNPAVLSPDEVSDDLVAKEKEIWTEQLKAEGKPEEIMEKIMMGKEKKFREESALLKQSFVKNPDVTIEKLAADNGAKVVEFVRFG